MSTAEPATKKPIVNLDFARALRAAATEAGHHALAAIVDAAIRGDMGAAEHVGAIMHGATWTACPCCLGSGKNGRKRCPCCLGSGEDATFPERTIRPLRTAAFATLGI